MSKASRISYVVCILLAFSFFAGCSDDDPASTRRPPEPPVLGGSIGVYADVDGTDKNLVDTGANVTFYVVHKVTEGATASQFRIEAPAGWVRIGSQSQFPVSLGDVDAGVAIGYGECLSGTIHLMTLTYQSPGNTPPGSMFKVLPHMQLENIEVVDCSRNLLDDAVGEESPVVLP